MYGCMYREPQKIVRVKNRIIRQILYVKFSFFLLLLCGNFHSHILDDSEGGGEVFRGSNNETLRILIYTFYGVLKGARNGFSRTH